MKKMMRTLAAPLMALVFLFTNVNAWGQNSFNSGDGWGAGWGTGASFSASAGSSLIYTTTNSSGGNVNRFFRFFGNGTPCSQYGPSGSVDVQLSTETAYTSSTITCGSAKAFSLVVPNTTDNWVFKSNGVSSQQIVIFRVQGVVRTVTAVSQSPSSNVRPGQSVTVSATMSGTQSTGQNYYLRYSTDNFATSTIVAMTVSSTTATGTIPGFAEATSVRYYVFTSGTTLPTHSDADFRTINLNNNAGSNYSYTVAAPAQYTWNQTGTASYATAANWTPSRTTAAVSDILIFNNAATTTVTNVPIQTIGGLQVSGNTTVNLQPAAAGNTLTVSNYVSGADLTVASGSALNANGANSLILSVGTGATGSITGSMTFSTSANSLIVADANGLTFNSGATFTQNTGNTGNVFGNTGTQNTVIFASGSTFIQVAGSAPFGLTQPSSKVTFQTGSLYRITVNQAPTLIGRTYANFEWATGGTQSGTGASALAMDSLIVSSGTLNINLTASTTINSGIRVANGATLTFTPASSTTINLNGAAARTITVDGNGTATFASNTILAGTAANIGITKAGTGTLTLAGANTFTGSVSVNGGVLNIQNATGLGTTAGGVTVSSGAALELQGAAVGAETLSLTGTGVSSGGALRFISGTNSWAGAITLTGNTRINADAGTNSINVASGNAITGTFNLTIGGAGNLTIEDPIATSTGTLTKDGAGTLTLSGANTYTGTTTINAGSLTLGVANALPVGSSAGVIQFAAGTPTFNLGAFNLGSGTSAANSAGALDFDVNTTVNLSSTGSYNYYFKASEGQTWAATTITINNWSGTPGVSGSGNKIFIGSSASLTSQLSKITFTGFTGCTQLSTGEIVPTGGLNPGFETTPVSSNGWTLESGSTTWSTSTSARSGSNRLNLVVTTTNARTASHTSGYSVTIPSTGINYIHVIGYAREATEGVDYAYVSAFNGTAAITGSLTTDIPNSWTQLTASGIATNGTTYYPRFNTDGNSTTTTGDDYSFDDIIIYTSTSSSVDLTAPAAPTSPSTTANGSNVQVSWTAGADNATNISGIDGVLVLRTSGTGKTAPTPNNQAWYSTTSSIGPASIVSGSDTWTVISNLNPSSPLVDASSDASNVTGYTYAIYMRDKAFNYSTAATVNYVFCPVTYTSVSSSSSALCEGSSATITVNGLLASTAHTITYSIGASTGLTASSTSNSSGVGTFTVTPTLAQSGATLTITNVSNGTCSLTPSSSNTATLPTVNATPTYTSVSSSSSALCAGSSATITVNGLLASTAHTITYSIGATIGLTASLASGVSTFSVTPTLAQSGATLTITQVATSTCSLTVSSSNTATLPTVNPIPTYTSVSSSSSALCTGSSATITVNGLLASTAHTITYSIGATTGLTASSTSNGSGVGTFSVSPSVAQSGATLTITQVATSSCSLSVSTTNTATLPTVLAAGTWIGGTSTDWNDASNWCGGIPTSSTNVVINTGATNYPNLSTGADGVANSITINSGGSLTMGGTETLTITSGGTFTNNSGTSAFTAGSSTTLIFGGTGTINGSFATTLNNLTISAAITLTTPPTINGTFRMNGGSVSASPVYGANSTLEYNTGSTSSTTSFEWTGGASSTPTAGSGIPANVTVVNWSILLSGNRGIPGNLTLNTSSNFNLNAGDLYIGGNINDNGSNSWTNNSKAVFFVGSGTSVINKSGRTQFFDYLIIDKSSGGSVQIGANTDLQINTTSGDVLQLNNAGQLDLNGRTLTLNNTNGNIATNGSGRTITSGVSGGTLAVMGNKFVTGSGTLIFDNNVTVRLTAGMDFGISKSTVNGSLRIDGGGFVSTNPPTYGGSSTLQYSSNTNYGVATEWTTGQTSGPGVPQNVTVSSGTAIFFPSAANNFYQMRGNLTYATPSSGASSVALSNTSGGDLRILGNWIENTGGIFAPNGREVDFIGTSSSQSITAADGSVTFERVEVNNTNGVSLGTSTSATINTNLTLTNGNLNIGANNLTFGASASVSGTFGSTRMIIADGGGEVRKTYSGTGSFTFPVGDNTGTAEYSPATLNFTSGSFSSAYAAIKVANAKQPDNTSTTDFINRYWTVTTSGITSPVCTASFVYTDADINGTEGNLNGLRYLSSTLNCLGAVINTGTNTISASGLSAFGDFTAGQFVTTSITAQPSTSSQSVCVNLSTTNLSVTASGSGLTYQWFSSPNSNGTSGTSLGDTNGAQTSTLTPQNSSIGTLYYYCVVTGTCGAVTSNVSGGVTISGGTNAGTLGGTQIICASGGTATFTSSVSGGLWSRTGTEGVADINSTTGVVTPIAAGSTTMTYTVAGSGGCTEGTATRTITVDPVPTTANAGLDQTVCAGATITLAATPVTSGAGTSGAWTIITGSGGNVNSGSNPSSTFTGNAGTTYTLRWTTTGGTTCTSQDEVNITINPTTLDFVNLNTASATICAGGTFSPSGRVYQAGLTEAAGAGAGIEAQFGISSTNDNPSGWSTWTAASYTGQGGTGDNDDVYGITTGSSLSAGTYYYTFRYRRNGCSWIYAGTGGAWSSGTSGVLTVNANPTVNAGGALSAICQSGTSAAMGGSVGGGATGGTWTGGAGTWTNATNPSTATYTASASESGSITLTLTTSGGSCGTTSTTKTITVNQNPTANAGSALSAICLGGTSATMGGSVGGGATGGTWSGGAGSWTNANDPSTATYTSGSTDAGSVTLTLTTSGGSCGTTTTTKTIFVGTTSTSIAPTTTQSITISTNGTQLTATEGTNTVSSRQWGYRTVSGTGAISDISGATSANYTPNFATEGTYYVVCRVTYGSPCSTTITSNEVQIDVVSNSITTGTINGSPFCAGATGVSVPFTYATAANFPSSTFTAQLSDASGSFASPVSIGTVSSNASGSQSISATIPSNTANGTGYRIRVVSNSPAVQGTDNGVNLTINSTSVGGTATPAASSVCTGSGTTIDVTGNNGATIQWEQSADGSTGWGNVSGGSGATSSTYTTPNLSAETYYRASVANGACAVAYSSVTSVGISPTSVGGTINSASVCLGATSGTLTLTGNTGSVTKWQSSTAPFSSWSDIASTAGLSSYTSGALTQTTRFRAVVTSGTCASANSAESTVSVDQSNAASAAYSSNWSNGQNDGATGFNAWELSTTSGDGGQNGFFTGSSDINVSSLSWGLYANSNQTASAVRPFTSNMSIGSTLNFSIDNGTVAGSVGFGLRNSSGENLMEFYSSGGAAYTINDGAGANPSGISFTTTGLDISISYTAANKYSMSVTPTGGGTTVYFTERSFLSSPSNKVPAQIRFFNFNAGSGGAANYYVNKLSLNRPAIGAENNFTTQTVCVGGTPTALSVDDYGVVSRQWYENSSASNIGGSPVSLATNATISPSTASVGTKYYYYIATGACSSVTSNVSAAFIVSNVGQTWVGATSSDWNTASNWSCGVVPTSVTNVTIPSGTTNSPNISSADASANSITINSGATLTMSGGYKLTMASGGTFTNNGTFTRGNGTVEFAGAGTVNGSATTTFNNLTTNTGTLTLTTAPQIDGTFDIKAAEVSQAPVYTSNSTLRYSTTRSRSTEWSANGIGTIGTTAGYPNNVTITGGTFSVFNTSTGIARAIAGNLTVNSGATFTTGTLQALVTIGGNITNNGSIDMASSNSRLKCTDININSGSTVTLSLVIGGDLEITGDLVENGTLNTNGRAVFFTGGATQNVSGTGATIDYIVSQKSAGSIVLGSNLSITSPANGSFITLTNATDIIDLNGYTLTLGSSTFTSSISGNGLFKGGGNSSLIINGGGNIGTVRFVTTTPGTTNALNNLTINRVNSGAVTLGSDLVVNGTATLTSGLLNIGSNNLTFGASATAVAGSPTASNMIVATGSGEVRKVYSAAGSFTFPVGDNTGTAEYSPVTLDFTSGSFTGSTYAGVKLVNSKYTPNTSTTDFINRYWTVTSDIASPVYTGSFVYASGDINGTATNLYGGRYLSSTWNCMDGVNVSTKTISKSGMTAFGDYTAGEFGAVGCCINPTTAGEISGNQTICSGGDPAAFTSVSAPTGASGTLEYKWQFSSSATFASDINDISSSNSATYNPPSGLTATRYYRRLAIVACKTPDFSGAQISNILTVTVNAVPSITSQPSGSTICVGGSYSPTVTASGGVTLSYQWQYSSDNSTWNNVENGTPTNASYSNTTSASTFSVSGNIAAGTYYYRCVVSSTGNGCTSVNSNSATLTINAPAMASAGTAVTTCSNSGAVSIVAGASASNNAGTAWTSSGTGTFSATNTVSSSSYTPSAADITAGSVTLTLTATGNTGCSNATDTKTLTITAAPTASAGTAATTCSNSGAVSIVAGASASNNAGTAWTSSGTGSFSSTNTVSSSSYTPSAADITAGSVTLTLTATGNSGCSNATDTKTLTITAAPTANAGTAVTTCSNSGAVSIVAGASASNNAGTAWTSSGTGTFSATNTVSSSSYTPSAADITAGSVTLTLTATGNTACANATDTKTLTITAAPTANAGTAVTTCSNSGAVSIVAGASASNNAGTAWTSSGTGTFSATNSVSSSSYTPSAADITAGSVTLTLTATGNAGCSNATDTKTLTINPAASVTTTAVSSITNTTASGGGTSLSTPSSISAKGVVWNTSTAPTTANSSTSDGTGTANFTSSLTSLSPQTLYYVRAYATDDCGTGYGNEVTFRTLSNPPTVQASGLSGTATSTTNINLSWSAATFPESGATTTGYVLLRATSPNTPSLSNGNGAAPSAGTNTTIVSSSIAGNATSASNGSLTANTTYNYLLVPFTWDGTNASTYNYLTTSAPTASAATFASAPSAQPTAITFSAVTSSTITTGWTAATGSPAGYIVLRSTGSAPDTDPVTGTAYTAGNTLGNATVVYVGSGVSTGSQTGLTDGTTYFYEVYSYNGSGSQTSYLTTSPLSGSQATSAITAPVATAATSVTTNTFTANWDAVSGAVGYRLDVAQGSTFTPTILTEGFEGATFPPTGWTNTGWVRSTTAADVFSGSAAAAATSNTGTLTTSALANPTSLSFYLGRTNNTTAKTLTIQVSTTSQSSGFTTVATYDHSNVPVSSYNQYTVDLSAYSSNSTVYVRFNKTSTTTSPWRLDDINITGTATNLVSYNNLTVSSTSQSVSVPTTCTTYVYRVRAVGSNSTSANSNTITVSPAYSDAPTASASQSFCATSSPTVANLSATGSAVQWYQATSGGSALSSGSTLSNGTIYYASQTASGFCESNSRTAVTVTLNPGPTSVSAGSDSSICTNSSLVLSGSATGAAAGASGPATALSETFNSGLPATWTAVNSSTGGTSSENAATAWTNRSNGYNFTNTSNVSVTINSNDNSAFMLSNSDAGGSTGTTNTTLTSPAFSLANYTAATLSFWHYYRDAGTSSDSAIVQISTDGTNYSRIGQSTTTQGSPGGFVQSTINLSSYLGQSNVRIRFFYKAVYDWYWAIDNVTVTGTAPLPLSVSYSWTPSTGLSATNIANPTASPSATTTYTVTATSNGCSVSDDVVITVNSRPTPTFTAEPGASVTSGNDVTYTTQSGQSNYVWSVPGTLGTDYSITSGGIGTSSNTVTLKWLSSGSKTVTVNYNNASGCNGSSAASNTTSVTLITVTLSNPSGTFDQIAAGDVNRNTTGHILSKFRMVVADGSTTLTALNFTTPSNSTTNSYLSTDVTNFKLYYTDATSFATTNQIGSTVSSGKGSVSVGEPISFSSLSQSFAVGTYYLWITADFLPGATSNRTISIPAPTLTFSAGTSTTNNIAASGMQTIKPALPVTYYLVDPNAAGTAESWNTLSNGSGNELPSLTSNDVTLIIDNTITASFGSDLALGDNSKLIVGLGTNLTKLAISARLTGTVDVGNNATLELNQTSANLAFLTFGTLSSGSTVQYSRSSAGSGGPDQTIKNATYPNLTIGGTGVKSASAALTVNETLTVSSGATLNLVTFALTGNLTGISGTGTIRTQNTTGTPIPSGRTYPGTVQYDATTGGQTIVANTYGILTLGNTSGTQTAGGNIIATTVNNGNASATLDMTSFALTGATGINNSGTILTQSTASPSLPSGLNIGGTVNYNRSTGGQTVAGNTYATLTLGNTSGTQTASGDITATTLTNTSGSTLNLATYALAGTTINNTGATIRTQNTGNTPLPSGITIGGTVNYDATTGAQNVMANTYSTLTMGNTSGTQTATGNVITSAINTTAGGTFDISTFSLKITGVITCPGKIDADQGTLELASSGIQEITGTMFTNKNIFNLQLSNTDNVKASRIVEDTVKVLNKLSFGHPNGRLSTNGLLTLASSATRTAFVDKMSANHRIDGNVTVERYINTGTESGQHGKSWQFLSAPIKGAQTIRQAWQEGATSVNQNNASGYGTILTSNDASATGFDIYTPTRSGPGIKTWNAATQDWVGVSSTSSVISNTTGYMVFVRGDRSVTTFNAPATTTRMRTAGTLYQPNGGNAPEVVSITNPGFYAIGNPYASAISYDLLSKSGIDKLQSGFIVFDPTLSGSYGVGGYQTISGIDYRATPGNFQTTSTFYNTTSDYRTIQSGQAFFVRTASGVTSQSLASSPAVVTFTEECKVEGSRLANRPLIYNLSSLSTNLIAMGSSEQLADGNRVVFASNLSNDVDGNDAQKIGNAGENFGLIRNGRSIAVEARNTIKSDDTLYYNMSNLRAMKYQLMFIPENMPMASAELIDKHLNTRTPVSVIDTTYVSFNVSTDAASAAADRFMLVFKPSAPVPVTFTSITANRNREGKVDVNWKTENEVNIKHYELERSSNGRAFDKINTKAAAANNGSNASYSHLDETPLQGANFYRVKAIGENGQVQYSAIVKVAGIDATPAIAVYPNPVKEGKVNVSFTNKPAGNYNVQMINSIGQVVYSSRWNVAAGNNIRTIELGNQVASGIYQLRIVSEEGESEVMNVQVVR